MESQWVGVSMLRPKSWAHNDWRNCQLLAHKVCLDERLCFRGSCGDAVGRAEICGDWRRMNHDIMVSVAGLLLVMVQKSTKGRPVANRPNCAECLRRFMEWLLGDSHFALCFCADIEAESEFGQPPRGACACDLVVSGCDVDISELLEVPTLVEV